MISTIPASSIQGLRFRHFFLFLVALTLLLHVSFAHGQAATGQTPRYQVVNRETKVLRWAQEKKGRACPISPEISPAARVPSPPGRHSAWRS
jgi:hypothetical protein